MPDANIRLNIQSNVAPVVASLRQLGTAIAATGAAVAGLSLRAISNADAIGKMADRIGTSARFLDEMGFAANRSGSDVTTLNIALTALARRAAAQPALFEKWGVSIREVDGSLSTVEQLLPRVSDRIRDAGSNAEQLALAQDLMSEAGRKLVPAFAGGSDGLRTFAEQAQQAGVVITAFERSAAALANDTFGILQEQSVATMRTIGAVLTPTVAALARAYGSTTKATREWFQASAAGFNSGIQEALIFLADNVVPALAMGMHALSNIWRGWGLLANFVTEHVNRGMSLVLSGVERVLRPMQFLADKVGLNVKIFEQLADGAKFFADLTAESADAANKKLLKLTAEVAKSDEFFQNLGVSASTALRGISVEIGSILAEMNASVDEALASATFETPWINTKKTEQSIANLQDFLQDGLGQVAASITSSVSGLFDSIINSDGETKAGEVLKRFVGSAIMQLGQMVFQAGVAATLLAPLGILPGFQAYAPAGPLGAAAIAGGLALIATGAAIKGGGGSTSAGSSAGGAAGPVGGATLAGRRPRFAGGSAAADQGGSTTNITNVFNFTGAIVNPRRLQREVQAITAGAG